ncbi:MAG: energy transducer TonB, partial [Acidobacteriaceae bacterium]|nr:energy transducer TonB [Acidobacteriaceae bacterium]
DIDTGGRVKVAKLIKPGTDIPEALRDSVLQAARQWVFTPATMHGKPVSSDHTIVFDFRPRAQ